MKTIGIALRNAVGSGSVSRRLCIGHFTPGLAPLHPNVQNVRLGEPAKSGPGSISRRDAALRVSASVPLVG